MRGSLLLVAALVASALAEEIGPFQTTPASPVAPDCVRDGSTLQVEPAVAFGRSVYLAAWSDGSRTPGKESADIYCSRVEPKTGRSLDPKGIVVCRAAGLQARPTVAFDGTSFLVVWEDLRSEQDFDLYAARVTEEGKVLEPDGFPIIKRPSNQAWPAVAFAGGCYVVAWMDARQYPVYGIYFARVSPSGKVLDPEGIPLDVEDAAKIAKVQPPAKTWLGDKNYWWHDLASRMAPAIASNGRLVPAADARCLVVYQREYPFAGSGRPMLACALVNPADASVSKPVKVAGGPSPVWAGKTWALGGPAWKGGWTPTPLLGAACLPETPVETKEAGATLDVVAAFGGGYNVGKGSTASFPSAAAFNGKNAIVAMQYAWRKSGKERAPAFAILLVRVATEGEFRVLDPKPLVAASAASPACVNRPALAAGPDGECLLAYEEDSTVAKCLLLARIIREK